MQQVRNHLEIVSEIKKLSSDAFYNLILISNDTKFISEIALAPNFIVLDLNEGNKLK